MTISNKTPRKSVSAFIAGSLLALAACGALQSAEAGEPVHAKNVSFGDLNLDSEQGARALLIRLRVASREVCASLASPNLSVQARWQACFDHAMADAVSQINSKAVTAAFTKTNEHAHS